jgi:hypothetical protein
MIPKDRPFPKFARDYFVQLSAQYELVIEETGQQPRATIAQLIARAQQNPEEIRWADVFSLETGYLYALADSGDVDRLRAEVLYARARYRDIVGVEKYAEYAQCVTVDVSKLGLNELRAELMALGERMRYIYTFVPPKEAIRNKIAMDAAWWTLGGILLGLLVYIAAWLLTWQVIPLLVVGFVGEMGGFLSVQQRLQSSGGDDPLYKELLLTDGWFSVVVIAPLSGAVFAIVLYFVFVGGLLSGGLFPRFGPLPVTTTATASATLTVTATPQNSPMGATAFLNSGVPSAAEDWGKLLVWAFIAGFAERFVPDVLNRLTGQASPSVAKPATPASGDGKNGDNRDREPRDGEDKKPPAAADESDPKEAPG